MRGQSHERSIADTARRQYGVISRRQLRDIGLSADAIDRRLAAGRLHAIHRGVYAVGHTVLPREGRWLAAVLACGPGAALSGRAAAVLWGIRRGDPKPEVSVPGQRRPKGIKVRRGIHPAETSVKDTIPVTTPARTLLDLAGQMTRDQLARAIDETEALRLFDLADLQRVLDRHRGQPGTRRLADAIAAWEEPPLLRSELERRFLTLCTGLPDPICNGRVGPFEVDFHWPDHGLVVEIDGPHHFTRHAAERDRERDADLLVLGYRTLRFTQRGLPRARARVEEVLSTRRGARAPRGSSSRGS